MLKKVRIVGLLSVALALSACGGGGGGGGAAPISATAAGVEGFWSGPASTGYNVSAVILENSQVWGIYSSGNTIYGALYGSATATASGITISGTDFNFLTNSSSAGTLTGTYSYKSSISASSAQGTTVALTYGPAYDTAASSASMAGTYSFVGRSGSYSLVPANITVNTSGAFTLAQTNCATSGTIVPRPNGKNIFDVNLTSAGSGCAVGYSSLSGVGYLDTSVTPNKLLILALKADRSDGLIVIGTKQ